MPDVPYCFLYGETKATNALKYLFVASLEESLPRHDWYIRPHRRDHRHQLLFVEDGQVDVRLGDMNRSETGQCILSVPSKVVHGFTHEPGVRGYIVTIVDSFLHGLFRDAERQQFPGILNDSIIASLDPDTGSSKDLENLVGQIVREYRNAREGQAGVLGACLMVLLVCLARMQRPEAIGSKLKDPRSRVFEDFRRLLERHYQDHYSVVEYAERLGLAKNRLNRICQRYAGQNAVQMLHGRLVSEARCGLIYVGASMREIACEPGFKDPAHSSRFFARRCGEAPGRCRARLRRGRDTL